MSKMTFAGTKVTLFPLRETISSLSHAQDGEKHPHVATVATCLRLLYMHDENPVACGSGEGQ